MRSPCVISESDIRNTIRDAYAAGMKGDDAVLHFAQVRLVARLFGPLRRVHREFIATEAN